MLMQEPRIKTLYRRLWKPNPFQRWSAGSRALPDFLVIGAMRSGTTSLHERIIQHPGVRAAIKKEIHFFDLEYSQGLSWYQAHFPSRNALQRAGKITGEASPYYLFHPLAPIRAAQAVPRVKLIVILRNPIDRAYSHYWHGIRHGYENRTFEEAVDQEAAALSGEEERLVAEPGYYSRAHHLHSYLSRGLYADQLARWRAVFPAEQFLVLENTRFAREAESETNRLWQFLGLAPAAVRPARRMNKAAYPEMDPATRNRLAAYFKPANERLYQTLGTRFSWDMGSRT
jgi:hypothetical protein